MTLNNNYQATRTPEKEQQCSSLCSTIGRRVLRSSPQQALKHSLFKIIVRCQFESHTWNLQVAYAATLYIVRLKERS